MGKVALALLLVIAAPAAKSHANGLAGRILSVDAARRTLVVEESGGRKSRLVWTGATRISGGALAPGARVTVRWVARDGKRIATVLRVGDVSPRPTPSPAPTRAAPTPR
jgi:hypothetical protein